MLLMDYNEDRSLPVSFEKSNDVKSFFNFGTPLGNVREVAGKVHINTLSSFNHFGGGALIMTDVKRMTATDDFLKMSLKDKKCEEESYEDCRTRNLLEKCNCIPWEVPGLQVKSRQVIEVLYGVPLGNRCMQSKREELYREKRSSKFQLQHDLRGNLCRHKGGEEIRRAD